MHKITVETKFCAAHRLPAHLGKCRFFHGHNYRVLVTVFGNSLQDGMLTDFSIIKKLFQNFLDDEFDHRLILQDTDPLVPSFTDGNFPLEQLNNIRLFPAGAPTAENMAEYFFRVFSKLLETLSNTDLRILSVVVYETDTSRAEYGLPPRGMV